MRLEVQVSQANQDHKDSRVLWEPQELQDRRDCQAHPDFPARRDSLGHREIGDSLALVESQETPEHLGRQVSQDKLVRPNT